MDNIYNIIGFGLLFITAVVYKFIELPKIVYIPLGLISVILLIIGKVVKK